MLVFSSSDSTTAPGAPKSVNMFDGRVHGLALCEERMPQNSATVRCRGEYKVSVSEVPLSTYLAIVAAFPKLFVGGVCIGWAPSEVGPKGDGQSGRGDVGFSV